MVIAWSIPVTASSHTELPHLRSSDCTTTEAQLTPAWIERYLSTVEISPQDAVHVLQPVLTPNCYVYVGGEITYHSESSSELQAGLGRIMTISYCIWTPDSRFKITKRNVFWVPPTRVMLVPVGSRIRWLSW